MKNNFTVFESSLIEFLAENGLGDKANNINKMRGENARIRDTHNCYYMQDVLNFKLDNPAGIKAGQTVVITLSDEAEGSRKKLINTYTYKAYKYDDVTLKLKLEDFKVKLKEEEK